MTESGLGRGVLYPGALAGSARRDLLTPAAPIARFVEFYWLVRWDLRDRPPQETKVLSHPSVHLTFEPDGPLVYGIQRDLFVRKLEDCGQVLGVKFRPGCFRPFVATAVSCYVDRRVPAAELFGPRVHAVNERIMAVLDQAAIKQAVDAFLLAMLPEPDPLAEEVAAMVGWMTGAESVMRVSEVAEHFAMSVRRLQRLFVEYVGASPKWVLRRARLHEAATRADDGTDIDWATLAADLGYADQAHLIRDFTAAVGESPSRYARA